MTTLFRIGHAIPARRERLMHILFRNRLRMIILGMLFIVILGSAGCSNRGKFRPFFFVQVSDPQIGMVSVEQDSINFTRAVQRISQLKPRFAVITGDFVHHADSAREWEVFDYIAGQIPHRIYYAPGNHDIGMETDPELLKRYRENYGKEYYSAKNSGCLFVILNSQYYTKGVSPEAEEQTAWLKDALHPPLMKPEYTFVFMHIPLFRANVDEADSYEVIPRENRMRLLEIFLEGGVDCVVTGHNHANHENRYDGIELISTASTSKILGTEEYGPGFRIFEVYAGQIKQYYVELDEPLQRVILRP